MAKLTVGDSVVLRCPYGHEGERHTDNTIEGTQSWSLSDESLASLTIMEDGSVTLSALVAGQLDINYQALGMNESGAKVELNASKQFTIEDAEEPEPEPVPEVVAIKIMVVRE